jgi:hypothetical protein
MRNRFHGKAGGAAALISAIIIALAFAACAGPGDAGARVASDEPVGDGDITVSIAADCLTLLGSDPELARQVSNEGVILGQKNVTLKTDASVYDVIKASGIAFAGKTYISSIGGLSEGDGGGKSGWMYSVNGAYPPVGVTKYVVKNGDSVRFCYTLDGGNDVRQGT